MRMHLWALGLLACGGPPPVNAPDSGLLDAGLDAGAAACEEPARACPEEPPYTGALCEDELVCTYDDADGTEARCEDGRWSVVATCPGCVPRSPSIASRPSWARSPARPCSSARRARAARSTTAKKPS